MWKLAKYVWARDAWEQKRRNYINLKTKIICMDTFYCITAFSSLTWITVWYNSFLWNVQSSWAWLTLGLYSFSLCIFLWLVSSSLLWTSPDRGILSCLALYLPQQTGLTPGGPWWLFADFLQHVTFLLLGSTLFTIWRRLLLQFSCFSWSSIWTIKMCYH